MKTYEARIVLTSSATSIVVRIQARNPSDAKKLIEAQYGSQFKRWASSPREVKN